MASLDIPAPGSLPFMALTYGDKDSFFCLDSISLNKYSLVESTSFSIKSIFAFINAPYFYSALTILCSSKRSFNKLETHASLSTRPMA
jgi:hypothetical protein